MKKLIVALLALVLLLPALALASEPHAEIITRGEETTIFFTDDEGKMYLIIVTEDGAQTLAVTGSQSAPAVPSAQTSTQKASTQKAPAKNDTPCWRCGESLAYGNHTAGNCGYKYHSACTDSNFRDPQGHELCPICNKCMYTSGSRHGVGYSMCGVTYMLENETCKVCGDKISNHSIHTSGAPYTNCWGHCYIPNQLHPSCPICGEALCNGQEHSAKGCAKKVRGNG